MATSLIPERRYLTRKEASAYLTALGYSVAVRTLAKMACYGGGPNHHSVRNGRRVLYPRDALEAWVKERMGPLRRTTSDKA